MQNGIFCELCFCGIIKITIIATPTGLAEGDIR